ncbi:MAG: excinuclease subunit [Candidatus Dependentiae bacterium]|nr:excinuclease subunit [Candidatus Dependentiae bacterium]
MVEDKKFKLVSPYKPAGSQPEAIAELKAQRLGASTLLGVTGSGKTFTLANIIESQNRQVLVLSPNKTLAAQLYEEFSRFFPENKVCYFVSYYDYYQPESYLPAQDIYIPKETKINSEIERLRVEATASLVNRRDVIVIASVSAIYSLGNPADYRSLTMRIKVGDKYSRTALIADLIAIQYQRNDVERASGSFQVLGNLIVLWLPYMQDNVRIELFGDTIERIEFIDRINHRVLRVVDNIIIFPAKHFVTTEAQRERAIVEIQKDLKVALEAQENPLYKERLRTRVGHDITMLRNTGYCSGIENYSRYFEGREAGGKPYCLLDFFDKDFLLVLDESHIAIPQLGAMYNGDRSRKTSLIEYGFRLPSAYDNRPLQFSEIEQFFNDVIFVSATPGKYELERSQKEGHAVVEQVVRPTGILDPEIVVMPREGQLDNVIERIHDVTAAGYRTLVTVLTKKMAEEMADYLEQKGIKVCYLHSEIKTPERAALLLKLRQGVFDCLVGINLLREGLDLPEVALVAIMDADIEGFLRDERSLMQTIGRAARNINSVVVLYADKMTKSMKAAIDETSRRRGLQEIYNAEHGIVPYTVHREITESLSGIQENIAAASNRNKKPKRDARAPKKGTAEFEKFVDSLTTQMQAAAAEGDFERAIELREELKKLR